VDLKRELQAGKRTHNTELAHDLASFAVDGGLLVIGGRITTAGPARCAGSNWPSSLIAWIRLRDAAGPVAAPPDSDNGRHDDRGLGGLLPGRHRPGCNGAGGDDILGSGAASITRAITIDVPVLAEAAVVLSA
jgi:hypothetical protein